MPEMRLKQKQRWPVVAVAELPPGERKIVDVAGKSIGIFNVNGQFMAVLNLCPHELAPVCRGRVSGTTLPSPAGEFHWGREGEILFCPWHGWEFDLLTGEALTDKRRHLKHYEVIIEAGMVFVVV